ncbi:MAG TPA: glycerol-3-phosphate acyltransferase [Candidatus Limnocylindria bacterium]
MPFLAIALSYVLSSISFPWLIARMYGVDLRTTGARKLGGSNLVKTVGVVPGITGGVLDGLKGLAAVLIARALGLSLEAQLLCGLAAIVGQMWPLFHRFDGGRANATGWGFAIAADPTAAFLFMGPPVYLAVAARLLIKPRPTRVLPIAALVSFVVFPVAVLARDGATATAFAGSAAFVLIEVRRLTAGLREDLATGAPIGRILTNRALYDRSELQVRGVVAI